MYPFIGPNRLAKYAPDARFYLQTLVNPSDVLPLPTCSQSDIAHDGYKQLINCSISRATWGKYASGLNAFNKFEEHFCKRFTWPLDRATIRTFIVWCAQSKGIQQSTTKGYIAALKFVHHLRGMSAKHLDQDPIADLLMKGSMHLATTKAVASGTRRVVTFPMLLTIGHRVASSQWDSLSKQVIWTAATTAFVGSARLGELRTREEGAHSPTSDLTWRDVAVSGKDSLLIRVKQPKTGTMDGEYIDLFSFKGYGCCPVKALYALHRKQMEAGIFKLDSSVFRFHSKKEPDRQQVEQSPGRPTVRHLLHG
jgi:hypothetical protein